VCCRLEPRVGGQGNRPSEICCMGIFFFLGLISTSHTFFVMERLCDEVHPPPSKVLKLILHQSCPMIISYSSYQFLVILDVLSRLFSELLCRLSFHVMHKIGMVTVMGHVRYKELGKVPPLFHVTTEHWWSSYCEGSQ
jgi:hypothetical protein